MVFWLCDCNTLLETYDRFFIESYRGDYYDRFRQDYMEKSFLKRHLMVVQVNDIYLATHAEKIREGTIQIYLQTRDPKVLTKIEKCLMEDRRIISHQPEDGFVSYSTDFGEMIDHFFTDPETRFSFTLEEAILTTSNER